MSLHSLVQIRAFEDGLQRTYRHVLSELAGNGDYHPFRRVAKLTVAPLVPFNRQPFDSSKRIKSLYLYLYLAIL